MFATKLAYLKESGLAIFCFHDVQYSQCSHDFLAWQRAQMKLAGHSVPTGQNKPFETTFLADRDVMIILFELDQFRLGDG